ncbi:hypothetical protein EVG20_g2918 [Dentipellis fragilis]|uniref:Uncharacterized protein n=1 Tax=Dentipellis fragilis TaxID=205917 RepID=A0A4Y9Z7X2_9AGAM|nr:hypothetical protein EVG20_g2918 [Dentipellis fragilis]
MSSPPIPIPPGPLPLRSIFWECAEMEVDDRKPWLTKICSRLWAKRVDMILHYVGESDAWIWQSEHWRPAHKAYPHPEGSPFDRLGLNMSSGLFNVAKTLIYDLWTTEGFNRDDLLALKISPYVIMYACVDYNMPFPPSFDLQFFWDHLSHLVAAKRPKDLFLPKNDAPNRSLPFSFGKVVHNETYDPDNVLGILHTYMLSRGGELHRFEVLPHVYLAANADSTAAVYRTDDPKTLEPAFKRSFCLKSRSTNHSAPRDSRTRLADAALHAAVCWAPLWEGWAVNFQVPSVRAAWALNDFADFSDEFPVLEALHTLAAHFSFDVCAGLVDSARKPACATEAEDLVRRGLSTFSEGSGLCHQAMDCVIHQYWLLNQFNRLWGTELQRYVEIMRTGRFDGYTDERILVPGLVYRKMREDQIFERRLASPPPSSSTPTPTLASWTRVSSHAHSQASSSLAYSATERDDVFSLASDASSFATIGGSRTLRDLRDVTLDGKQLHYEPTDIALDDEVSTEYSFGSLDDEGVEIHDDPLSAYPYEVLRELRDLYCQSLRSPTPVPSPPLLMRRIDGDPTETIALERVNAYWLQGRSIPECRRRKECKARGREMRRQAIEDDGHARAQRAPVVTFSSGSVDHPL